MPRVKPGDRQRAYRPKTRSGCRTFRHVKCDEARPICFNCASAGRHCLGYNDLVDVRQHSSSLEADLPRELSVTLVQTEPERRALEFYCVYTSVHIAGSIDDHAFWRQHVVQRAHVDLGIRHAIIALASFYEEFESGSTASCNTFALEQYNRAIREHASFFKKKHGPATVEAYLTCLVFVCIEMLRGNFVSAISLANKTVSLLHSSIDKIKEQGPESSVATLRFLERQFRRIEVQALGVIGPTVVASTQAPEIDPTIPSVFSSVSEAQKYLEFYGEVYILSANERTDPAVGGPADYDIRQDSAGPYMGLLQQWTSAFNALLAQKSDSLTDQERQTARILQMHQLLNHISLDASAHYSTTDEQMVWDNYTGEFDEIVKLAESILATNLNGSETSSSPSSSREIGTTRIKPSFSLKFVTVGPLYDVARRCRDPTIRRKAIDILRTFRRREGIWDSDMAVAVLERVVDIEEDGADAVQSCQDVPVWRRVFNVHPVFDKDDNKIVLRYERKASATRPVNVQMQEIITC